MKTPTFPTPSDFFIYSTPEGNIKIEALLRDETLRLNQDKIAQLFGVDRTVITKHLRNIYQEQELDEKATSAKIAQVQNEGKRQVERNITFYNLDAIIAVGYRVNSYQATKFRSGSDLLSCRFR